MQKIMEGITTGITTVGTGTWSGITTVGTGTWSGLTTVGNGAWSGLTTVGNGITTVGTGTWSCLTTAITTPWNGITTVASSAWGCINAIPVSLYQSTSTILSAISATLKVITLPIYTNLALFIGALGYDVYKGDSDNFKITNKFVSFLNEEMNLVTSFFSHLSSKMPNIQELFKLFKELNKVYIDVEMLYAEHYKKKYEVESSYKDLSIKYKALPGISVDNTSLPNTETSNETSSEVSDVSEVNDIPQMKNTIKINVKFTDTNTNTLLNSLITHNFKLYVTDKEKINSFFTEDVESNIGLDLKIDENSFIKSNSKTEYLQTIYFYNVLKNGEEITDNLKYCEPEEENEIPCTENTATKIINLSNELASQNDIVTQINKTIILAIKDSNYSKEELSSAINDCEKSNYDELICSPLFEGAVNEYFDSQSN